MMLNLILPRVAGQHKVQVVLANRKRPETATIPGLGWMKLFEQDIPSTLLFPMLDMQTKLDPTQSKSPARWLSFEALSRTYGVSFTHAGHIPDAATLTTLVKDAAPDLIVSFQFGFIFKPEALAVPRLGALNLHSGALPQRAGVNPTFWCMKDGDREAACTLHWIDQGIDSGPLLEVRPMQLDYEKSYFANLMANYRNGADMISGAIASLTQGQTLPSIPQVHEQRRYVPTPTLDDFSAFGASGRRLIDPEDFLEIVSNYLACP